jgi:hypothetical protein
MGSKVIRNVTKILKATSGRLFGRVTAGTGRAEELTPADVRTLLEVATTTQIAAAYQPIGSYQETLVSGTNIKTVNSTSLLGSGDIVVSASPAGSSGQVQFNDAGSFGGATAVVYAGSGTHVTVTAQSSTAIPLCVKGAASQTGNLFEARNSSGTLGARILSSLQFYDSGATIECAQFGGGNTLHTGTSPQNQTVIGNASTSLAGDTTIVGCKTTAKIGATAIGRSIYAADYSVCIGMVAGASGLSGGFPSGPDHTNCIVINSSGGGVTASGNFQWVVSRFTEAFWGRGVTNAAPENVRFQGTGGSGTNVAGATVRWAPGRSTGDATPASVILQRTVAGSSGTTAQTLSDALQVDGNTTAGETPLLLLDIDKGTLQRVSIGAADSGGAGFKVLRVPN